jgi:hypothetical protein
MRLIVTALLAIAGAIAAWFVSPDAGNFPIVQAAIAILLVVAAVALLVFLGRRRS